MEQDIHFATERGRLDAAMGSNRSPYFHQIHQALANNDHLWAGYFYWLHRHWQLGQFGR
jgi:hypothetical protein